MIEKNIYAEIGYYLTTGKVSEEFIAHLIDALYRKEAQLIQLNTKIEAIRDSLAEVKEVMDNE